MGLGLKSTDFGSSLEDDIEIGVLYLFMGRGVSWTKFYKACSESSMCNKSCFSSVCSIFPLVQEFWGIFDGHFDDVQQKAPFSLPYSVQPFSGGPIIVGKIAYGEWLS